MRDLRALLLGPALLGACIASPSAAPAPSPAPTTAPTPTPLPASPEPTILPTETCGEEVGRWVEFTYRGVAVNGDVPAHVYLPPCYDEVTLRYPVAFFLHGKPYTEDHWLDLGLAQAVEAAIKADGFPEAILILPRLPEPIFSGSDGGPGSYESEFLEGLVPAVDRSFRTDGRPAARTIVGISRGGVWALEIGFRHADLFGSVAALSPALAVNSARPAYDPLVLAREATALPDRVLLAAGTDDWARRRTEDLASLLEARNISVERQMVEGAHVEATWHNLLPALLRFIAAAFANG